MRNRRILKVKHLKHNRLFFISFTNIRSQKHFLYFTETIIFKNRDLILVIILDKALIINYHQSMDNPEP
jgi:hypothetical protein